MVPAERPASFPRPYCFTLLRGLTSARSRYRPALRLAGSRSPCVSFFARPDGSRAISLDPIGFGGPFFGTRNRKRWSPSARPEYSIGELQVAGGEPSSEQRNVAPP